jgi:hypothetical protein
MKKNKVRSFSGKWIILENTMVRKINQTQKDKLSYFFSYVKSRLTKKEARK